MRRKAFNKDGFYFLKKAQLVKLRLKAMRAGVWFKALSRIDRVLLDLTIRVAKSVRSVTLARNIIAVTRKLKGLLESSLSRAFRGVAQRLAQKLSAVAQNWGNTSARNWSSEVSFIKFLAIMHINQPTPFKM